MTKFIVTRLCLWADACTISPSIVLIHPRAAFDKPLRTHELVHVEQMKKAGTLNFWFRYFLSRSFRQTVEVEAYKAQISRGASLQGCARLLTGYWLDIDTIEATRLLKEGTL